jgi:hypothetical protein
VKVEPASDDENVNVAVALLVGPDGPPEIEVSGAVVSTVHVALAGVGSGLPAVSVAVTTTVCEPSPRPLYVLGDVHATAVPVSSLHVKVEPASDDVNEIDAVDELIVPDGACVIEVSGAPLSTVHVRVAGVASLLLAASVAVTVNVCEPSASPE